MKALVLPVVVLVAVLLSPAGCELYYVRGSSSSPDATPCPPEASPCLTLQEYVDNSTEFLPENMSDAEFHFLSGEHSLSKPFVVYEGRNISLRSANVRSVWDGLDVTVICSNNANFKFNRTSQLSIHGVAFHNCGGDEEEGALLLFAVADFIMEDVEIFNSFHLLWSGLYGNFSVSRCVIGGASIVSSFVVEFAASTFRIDFNSVVITCSTSEEWSDIALSGSKNYNDNPVTLRNVTFVGFFMVYMEFWAPIVVEKCSFSGFSSGNAIIVSTIQICVGGPTSIVDSSFSQSAHLFFEFVPTGEHMQPSTDTAPGVILLVSNCSFTGDYRYSESHYKMTIVGQAAVSNSAVLLKDSWFEDGFSTTITFLKDLPNVMIDGVHFTNNRGTPMLLINSTVHVFGENFFTGNRAIDGGGMAFIDNSAIVLHNNSFMVFRDNYATNVGGAWYVEGADLESMDSPFTSFISVGLRYGRCFIAIQPPPTSFEELNALNISVQFINNTALSGGNVLYGGNIDLCKMNGFSNFTFGSQLLSYETIFSYEPEDDRSRLASAATRVCLCDDNGVPDCTKISSTIQGVYPGQLFNISVVTVGQRFGVVNGTVYGQLQPVNGHRHSQIRTLFGSQRVSIPECTNLNYSVVSEYAMETLVLTAREFVTGNMASEDDINTYKWTGVISETLLLSQVQVRVPLLNCPHGFILSEELQCICDPTISRNGLTCDIDIGNGTVVRSGEVWVSYLTSNQSTGQDGVVVNMHCPYGYCNEETQHINLDNPDAQCNFNHTGILCGGCPTGLSLAFGSNRCLNCSNNFIALLIPFAVSGVLLVLFIQLLDLTVAVGTISGLLFYANILKSYESLFFVPGQTNILTVFISWLNLDFGIETCFFDGLDGYVKTWLQFAFPLYLWLLAGLIVLLSRFTTWVSAGNSVPVLATMFLLSHNKLLRTIINTVLFAPLKLPDNSTLNTWSFDANVPFAGSKHIVLVVTSLLVFALAWLPYTLVLLFYQCLLRVNHKRGCRWVFKLKPFFDANFGPLKDKHLYWVGVLLLARALLLLLFVASPDSSEGTLICITIVSSILILWDSFSGHAYKNWLLSLLENSFFVNLIILCLSTNYGKAPAIYTSTSIALLEFVGIVCYHCYKRALPLIDKIKRRNGRDQGYAEIRGNAQPAKPAALAPVVTHSEVDIRNPEVQFARRESLLED